MAENLKIRNGLNAPASALSCRRLIKRYALVASFLIVAIIGYNLFEHYKYLNPKQLNLYQYTLASNEFLHNLPGNGYIEKTNFETKAQLSSTLPLVYKLFRENKAELISYQNGCVLIILKTYSENLGHTEELIRTGGPNDCGDYSVKGNSSSVEKDVQLTGGWRYQRAKFFVF